MKISISKFYREVTGSNSAGADTCESALKRWNVPYDEDKKLRDRVDAKYLDVAKEAYRLEREAREARKAVAAERASARASTKPTSPYRGIMETLETHGAAIARIESLMNRIAKDLNIK